MILSVSRRTDIPSYYSEWFLNRIKAGFLYVRNPMNPHQVSKIAISPELVDCIVFWTKNPEPMLTRLEELQDYHYYFQLYAKNKKAMQALSIQDKSEAELKEFARTLSKIARENNIEIASCAETIDLTDCDIVHNSCIDRELIEKIIGCKLKVSKDKKQRLECGCVESIEVGTYDTCRNGCVYCYANNSRTVIDRTVQKYDVNSPILCGEITEKDKITERKVASMKDGQMVLWE